MKMYGYNGKKNICGEKVRLLRVKRDLSQSDLAAKMQVEGVAIEQAAISELERGNRQVTDYEAHTFAKVLGVTVDELFTPVSDD